VGDIFNITKYPLLPIPKNILPLDELYEMVGNVTNETSEKDSLID